MATWRWRSRSVSNINQWCRVVSSWRWAQPDIWLTDHLLRPVYSDTTQLDWPASRWLAVRCSTGSVALPIAGDSWVVSVRVSIATQLNSARRRVELRSYKRGFSDRREVNIDWITDYSTLLYCTASSSYHIISYRLIVMILTWRHVTDRHRIDRPSSCSTCTVSVNVDVFAMLYIHHLCLSVCLSVCVCVCLSVCFCCCMLPTLSMTRSVWMMASEW